MNILVLGGNGYLGSKIVKELTHHNYNVFSTIRENSDLSRINKERCKFINATYDNINNLMSDIKIDYIVNMVGDYGKNGNIYTISSNLVFPLTVLEIATLHKVAGYITVGTALPIDLNLYSFTKNSFSEYGKFYSEKHGINFIDLKVQMYYGADEPLDRFIPSVIYKMICGDVVNTTYGTQFRDIISVDDVVNMIVKIMERNLSGYNSIDIGTGIAPSISELIDFIWDKTGKQSTVNKGAVQMRVNEPNCIADMSQVSRILNYKPIYWKDGISKMIEEIRRNL